MKWLEAKREEQRQARLAAARQKISQRKMLRPKYEDKALDFPDDDDDPEEFEDQEEEETEAGDDEEWTLKMSPEAYLKLHPDSKHSELARKLVEADDPEAG